MTERAEDRYIPDEEFPVEFFDIFIIDGSPSMHQASQSGGSKAMAVSQMLRDAIREGVHGYLADYRWVSVMVSSQNPSTVHPVQRLAELKPLSRYEVPISGDSAGLANALATVRDMVIRYPHIFFWICILSDGVSLRDKKVIDAVDELKAVRGEDRAHGRGFIGVGTVPDASGQLPVNDEVFTRICSEFGPEPAESLLKKALVHPDPYGFPGSENTPLSRLKAKFAAWRTTKSEERMSEEEMDESPMVPKTFDQLGILVLDGSGSMSEEALGKVSKAQCVSTAVRELFGKMKISTSVSNFSFAVVTFGTKAMTHTPITTAEEISDTADYDPMPGHGGGTDISAGLLEARKILDQFFQNNDDMNKSAVVILMTDGESKHPDQALRMAQELKDMPNVLICAAFFSKKDESNQAAKDLLIQLCSDPRGFTTVYDAKKLRDFFIASVAAAPQPKFHDEG